MLVDGEPVEVDAVAVEKALSIRIGGRVIDLILEGTPPTISFASFGSSGKATIETERTRATGSPLGKEQAGKDREALIAPMPGRVVRVLVSPGDHLQPGEPIAVIEAMKMENELRAAHAVTVAEVLVGAGDTVEGGAKLVLFE